MTNPALILASTSPWRRQLLNRLQLPFVCQNPQTDETPQAGESAPQLVERLAIAKARAVSAQYANTETLIIGSDQVCVSQGEILGKPGNHQRATAQLRRASGQSVQFFTGLCLFDCRTMQPHSLVEPFTVNFRQLSDQTIERYLQREQPYQCAGSFMCEGLGIMLFESLQGDDPNALTGLPLIRLVTLLQQAGVTL